MIVGAVAAAAARTGRRCFIFRTTAHTQRRCRVPTTFGATPALSRQQDGLVWIFEVTVLVVEAVLAIGEAAKSTGQPVRRLRQWCATGRIRCERDGRGWLIPATEIGRVRVIAAERAVPGFNRGARALVIPRSTRGTANLRDQVAAELQIPAETVSTGGMTIDGQAYLIATWPSAADARGSAIAELAELLDGELLD
jgi:hypothetical protein